MKINNAKILVGVLSFGLLFTACSNDNKAVDIPKDSKEEVANNEASKDKADYDFTVVSREDGSGTRGAFVEIVGLEEEKDGKKEDMTTDDAVVQNSTNGVMQTVSQDANAIGYISLGSLNDTVKALKVDGVEATEESVADKSYKISRPFNLAYKEAGLDDLSKDFLKYVKSDQGQKIVKEEGYVPIKETEKYEASGVKGTITVAGSTSITPLMEKMAEAYQKLNPDAKIEIQSNGSSSGIEACIDGAAQIAMASRELKDEEKAKLKVSVIATDGIAIVVNKESKLDDVSVDQLKDIFKGTIKNTSELGK